MLEQPASARKAMRGAQLILANAPPANRGGEFNSCWLNFKSELFKN